jgi:hypothetical protein
MRIRRFGGHKAGAGAVHHAVHFAVHPECSGRNDLDARERLGAVFLDVLASMRFVRNDS